MSSTMILFRDDNDSIENIMNQISKNCKQEKKYRKLKYNDQIWYQFEIQCQIFENLRNYFGKNMIFLEDIENIDQLEYIK